jgi:hypothetical protein
MVMTNKTQAETTITIGPRTRHEIELRIRELRARHNASPRDLREVARLEEFLRTVAPRDGRMAMIAVAAGLFALSLFLLCELPACARDRLLLLATEVPSPRPMIASRNTRSTAFTINARKIRS